jgi:hypothetical protein
MTADSIRKHLNAQPFHPFTVHTGSGRSFSVPHPDFAWITPNGRDLFVADETDGAHLIAVAHVTELSINGAKKSRRGRG